MGSTVPFTIEFAPKNTSVIIGREKIIETVKKFVQTYKKGASKTKCAILLHGPSGTGKTSLVTALAKELECELFELNASDKRNKDAIESILKPVTQTMSFFSSKKIILLDEIDGLSGTDDRGGASALAEIIQNSLFPVIMTANDAYEDKLKPLRKISSIIEVSPLSPSDVATILQRVAEQKNIVAETQVLQAIARKNLGDIRGSLCDLELLSVTDKKVTLDQVHALDERLKQRSMKDALTIIFKTTDPKTALTAFDDVDDNFDQWIMWIDYNVAKEYTGIVDRARAYGMLSRADVFKGRIIGTQHWRFLVYIKELLTAGVALSKNEPYKTAIDYKESSRPLKIWIYKNQVAKKISIAQKIAEATHTSKKSVMKNFAYYTRICTIPHVQEELGLDDAEITWIKTQVKN